ncbi:MAG: carbohydrate-binding domain-containing protein, partial [Clostridia bacterium]|nr:carbohydrate-binding domain-containing protein [Clostridia bacterium]
MKKLLSLIVSALLLAGMLPAAALAQTDVNLNAQNGRLLISEAGTYTLTGSMRGTVWVDPGQGDVTLIMDNMQIDGGDSAGIAAISGDSLHVILANGTVNRVSDSAADVRYGAAIYCGIPTTFEGKGRLDVLSSNDTGIRGQGADLTFASGSYLIRSAQGSVATDGSLAVQNAVVTDMNTHRALPATPVMEVQTGNNGRLNLRQEADVSSGRVGQYANGTQVTVLERQGDWSRVEVNGQTGYMMNQYLTPSQGQTVDSISSATPNASAANNRPQMPGGMNGQRGNANPMPDNMAMPGGAQTASSANPTDIVTSTAVNSAADLTADMDSAEYITMTDENGQVKISDSGTYVVTGQSSDGNITVKKGATGVVLVLDDLDLTSTTGATVAVNKEAQVRIVISGNVTLTDNENPEDENSTDEAVADAFDGAAMKFKANSQVYMTGDDSSLIIDGGVTVNINATNDGINGNYDVTLLDGSFTIAAGDDAIHADHILTIGRQDGSGPNIRVTGSNEGLEGTVVNVFGGDISIRSTDDAINAANGDGLYEGELAYAFNMTGGRIDVTSSKGDGIDSNGHVNLIGGTASISSVYNGGDAGIDYDGQYYAAADYALNNQSGMAGPDGMPGGMMNAQNGGMMNAQNGGMMNGQNGSMPGFGQGGQPEHGLRTPAASPDQRVIKYNG